MRDADGPELVAVAAPVLGTRDEQAPAIIGDRLTEVNVTSPTGLRQINRLQDVRLEDAVIDWLEARCRTPRLPQRPSTERSHTPWPSPSAAVR